MPDKVEEILDKILTEEIKNERPPRPRTREDDERDLMRRVFPNEETAMRFYFKVIESYCFILNDNFEDRNIDSSDFGEMLAELQNAIYFLRKGWNI